MPREREEEIVSVLEYKICLRKSARQAQNHSRERYDDGVFYDFKLNKTQSNKNTHASIF